MKTIAELCLTANHAPDAKAKALFAWFVSFAVFSAGAQPQDFGDAPTNYPTLLSQNGARHTIVGGVLLGALIDSENDGQPNNAASLDDLVTSDDEDGVTFLTLLTPGLSAKVQVVASTTGFLNAWIDFNRNSSWADAGDQVFTNVPLNPGNNVLGFNVPSGAVITNTYARFRFATFTGLTFNGSANNGEVEDYQVTVTGPQDFGDAPDPLYPTLLVVNGARHAIVANVFLGGRVDAESDGQPNANATGDDIVPSGADDEDGVSFVTTLTPGLAATVQVVAQPNGFLNAWMDFNADGDWADAGEQIFTNVLLSAGANSRNFTVPAAAQTGPTFARFRFTTNVLTGATPTGLLNNGEVEDYEVNISGPSEFSDAPSPYPTLLANNGARHTLDNNTRLGNAIDIEPDGQPNAAATGDDINPPTMDDEDGVAFTSALVPGQNASVQVVTTLIGAAGQSAKLDAWMDFNSDGDWADTNEQIFVSVTVGHGTNNLNFAVPTLAVPGTTFARYRLSREGGLSYDGPAPNGEVEDYQAGIESPPLDFSDAPEPAYPTTSANNGARHIILQGYHLGALVDTEPDGQPNATATGDDINPSGVPDDEDGVVLTSQLVPGRPATVQVTASQPGYLNVWMDFNGNGSWADPGDQIFTAQFIPPGPNNLGFNVPANALIGTTFARFRFSRETMLSFNGLAPDGEVEDYQVPIVSDRERCDISCEGRDFWLTFPGNYAPDPDNPVKPSLCIVGASGITGTVSIAGLSFTTNFTIGASQTASVPLPTAADLGDLNDGVTNKGIHVTASGDVSLYGMSKVDFTSDSYLALHSTMLGTEYIVLGWGNVHTNVPPLNGSQFAITACESNTTVIVTPSVTTGGHTNGVAYNLVLQPGDCYQLRNTDDMPADLTGTIITSDKPVAVFGSHQCANIPDSNVWFCDYIVEQLLPVNEWGTDHYTAPLATRTGGDTYRVLASQTNTTVSINGVPFGLPINRGQFKQLTLVSGARISADKPVLVAQYAHSADSDPPPGSFTQGDPFMCLVQATRHWENNYAVCSFTNGFPANFLNIIAPTGSVGTVQLNGAFVGAGAFTGIPGSGYAYAQVTVTAARNTVSCAAPIAVSAYGWAEFESYGHPACFFVGDVQPPTLTCTVTNVTVQLQPGTVGGCSALVPDLRGTVVADDNCSSRQDIQVTQTPAPGTPVGPGVHQVILTASDLSGNTATCVITLTVVDPSPVQIFCPSNIVVMCMSSNGAVVTYQVTAQTQCEQNLPVICNPPPGSLFPPGLTTVNCSATSSGGQSNSCSFTVYVRCAGKLTITKIPNTNAVAVTWTGSSGVLESAPGVLGQWRSVTNGVNAVTLPISQAREFFRVNH